MKKLVMVLISVAIMVLIIGCSSVDTSSNKPPPVNPQNNQYAVGQGCEVSAPASNNPQYDSINEVL